MGYAGLVLLIAGITLFVTSINAARRLERDKFERTNTSGVEEYDGYDEMMQTRMHRRRTGWSYKLGGILMLVGAVMTVAGFFGGGDEKRAQSRQEREAAREQALRDCMNGDGDACSVETYYRNCLVDGKEESCRNGDALNARRLNR